MATEDLRRLSLKLLATALSEDGCVYVPAKDYQATTAQLTGQLRDEVNRLVGEVIAIVPNDFTITLSFQADGVHLTAEFEDGNTGSFGNGSLFTSRKSMIRKMRSTNWDERRAQMMQQGSIFEDLVNEAQDRPVDIPSSEEAAQKFAEELNEVLCGLRRGPLKIPFCLITARNAEGVAVVKHETRDAMVSDIADFMTTGCDILAVIENGVAWTFKQIETVKLEAVEHLGPISRAKAERRFNLS